MLVICPTPFSRRETEPKTTTKNWPREKQKISAEELEWMLNSVTMQPHRKDRIKENIICRDRNYKIGYNSLTYLHSGNAASGNVPEDIKNEEEQAPFIKNGLVPDGCSASARESRHSVI